MARDSNSQSPKTTTAAASRPDAASEAKEQPETIAKTEPAIDAAKPLAPPPRPAQAKDTPSDYFTLPNAASLNQEPNPFERSFGGSGDPTLGANAAPETPGGTKLPPVAAITSPSSLLPGTGTTPFNWPGGSLRTGPLSPAMLSAPQADYFSDQFGRGGFPTPNESSLRTGLTPGGSGSMFPTGVTTPNTAALFNLGGVTPGTVDFHRTAMRAAAEQREQQAQQQLPAASQPQEMNGGSAVKAEIKSAPFDNHDSDAANGLFMLAQGNRNGVQQQSQYPLPPQPTSHGHPAPAVQHPDGHMNGNAHRGSVTMRGVSEAASEHSEGNEQVRPNTRGKAKRASGAGLATTNGRRKAEEAPPAKAPAGKKAKTGSIASSNGSDDMGDDDDGHDDMNPDKPKHKMTEEEKRKNFLERNRVAALKCRQRKKQWLANLQNKVDVYQQENDQLSQQITSLREEVVNLKTLLLAHKDCPVTQSQGSMQPPYMGGMDAYNAQMNPYGMGAPMPSHQMIPAQGNDRRYS
ncbi:Aft1 HRA domain-domain-containing protein [Coniella lustricola]|uniref:Aft1 HRA domain-domain-containing protein n=1 Tax=Coniella lustricola TaxID=2025994 RepID=A0A2T3A9T3_9PEZI|nr:Aft1 HRA domain-domain-containing protein [Coniella lustricola]